MSRSAPEPGHPVVTGCGKRACCWRRPVGLGGEGGQEEQAAAAVEQAEEEEVEEEKEEEEKPIPRASWLTS